MTLAGDVDELVSILTRAGLEARRVEGEDPALAPVVLVEAPTLSDGRRSTAGDALLEARCDLVAVPERMDPLPYLDKVLEALVAAGILVDGAVPTGHYAGDNLNPQPAYRVTVRWPINVPHTGGTP